MTGTLTGGTKCTNGMIILFDLKKAPACKTFPVRAFWASSLHPHHHPEICIEFNNNKQGLGRDTFQSLALNVVSLNFFSWILKSTASLWQLAIEAWIIACPEKAVKIQSELVGSSIRVGAEALHLWQHWTLGQGGSLIMWRALKRRWLEHSGGNYNGASLIDHRSTRGSHCN